MSHLVIKKNLPIKSGDIYFVLEADKNCVHLHGNARFQVGPFTKKFNFNQHEDMPKEYMLSSFYELGKEFEVKGTKIKVESVLPTHVVVSFDAEDFDGVAEVDITKELIDVITVNATGKYQGMKLRVDAYRV